MGKFATIYVARHGETRWNKAGILQGQMDSPLDEKGMEQARDLASSLSEIKFDQIYSSDLNRAKATAEAVASDQGVAIITDERLRERNFGRFQGGEVEKMREELADKIEERNKLDTQERMDFVVTKDMETDRQIADRMTSFMHSNAPRFLGKKILVVSHDGTMRKFLVSIGFADHKEIPRGSIQNHGYFVLKTDGVKFEVVKTVGISLIKG